MKITEEKYNPTERSTIDWEEKDWEDLKNDKEQKNIHKDNARFMADVNKQQNFVIKVLLFIFLGAIAIILIKSL